MFKFRTIKSHQDYKIQELTIYLILNFIYIKVLLLCTYFTL